MTQMHENKDASQADAPSEATGQNGNDSLDEVDVEEAEAGTPAPTGTQAPADAETPEAKTVTASPASPGEDVFMSQDEQKAPQTQASDGNTPSGGTSALADLPRGQSGVFPAPNFPSPNSQAPVGGESAMVRPATGADAKSPPSNRDAIIAFADHLVRVGIEKTAGGNVTTSIQCIKLMQQIEATYAEKRRQLAQGILPSMKAEAAKLAQEIEPERRELLQRKKDLDKLQGEYDALSQLWASKRKKLEELEGTVRSFTHMARQNPQAPSPAPATAQKALPPAATAATPDPDKPNG
ncbi:hypothetical protein EPO34_01635 [Patescibacteria group bacterium]|nr:MAG: hypothetical protein EPO34_01635 [Patescibacteria group bacterium]